MLGGRVPRGALSIQRAAVARTQRDARCTQQDVRADRWEFAIVHFRLASVKILASASSSPGGGPLGAYRRSLPASEAAR
ncbi:MAG: hypothetical protein A2Z30_03625 [Chloroflexi bacterium RBG_16_64_43]|nr:MAG: hypothetical protein A2Z30_03625 [Chloroflexi bacterium RBG_16_64_43]